MKIFAIPSFADGAKQEKVNKRTLDTTTGTYQMELWEIDTESLEAELLLIHSSELNEAQDIPDWAYKTHYVFEILEMYNHFKKGEEIHIYCFDRNIKLLINRLDAIFHKILSKPMRQMYKERTPEEFIDLITDKFNMLNRDNSSYEIIRYRLIELLPSIMNSPYKKILPIPLPKGRLKYKNSEYSDLDKLLFEIQNKLINRTSGLISTKLGRSKEEIDALIKLKWKIKRD